MKYVGPGQYEIVPAPKPIAKDQLHQPQLTPAQLKALEDAVLSVNNYTPGDWQRYQSKQPETLAQYWERMRGQT